MAEALKVGDKVTCVNLRGTHGIPHTADSQALHLGCQYTVTKVYELHDGTVRGLFLNHYHGGWWPVGFFEKYQKPEPTAQEWADRHNKANSQISELLEEIRLTYDKLVEMGYTPRYNEDRFVWSRKIEEVLK